MSHVTVNQPECNSIFPNNLEMYILSILSLVISFTKGPLESASDTRQLESSDFPKNLLFIENVGNEHPDSSGNNVLNEMLFVRLVVLQPPLEGKVVVEDLVAHVHQNRIHS